MSEDTSRNDIFNYQESMRPTPERMQEDLGFDIPVETVPLPSGGRSYPTDHPLHNCDTVDIRGMTAREEDILTSRALIKKGTVITHLIKSCLTNKDIDPDTLFSGDRNALMIALRITGYGPEYVLDIACPSCDISSKPEFNLADLPIKPLEIEPDVPGQNRFQFKLPMSGKTVTFKFLTGEDEMEISVISERMKKQGFAVENNITSRLQHSIVAVDGDDNKNNINRFIRHMPARDSLALRRYMDKSEPGIEMRGPFECHSCGHSQEVGLPIGPSFFWPDTE
jgi:hypothetical protein